MLFKTLSFKALEEHIDMLTNRLHLERETRRLENGPFLDEKPNGVGVVHFTAYCPLGAASVLSKVKTVLRILDDAALRGWPESQQCKPVLPSWFTSFCVAEMSDVEAKEWLARWQNLSPEDKLHVEREKDWSLNNWLFWMEPDNRQWFWWDAEVVEERDHIALAIEVEAWPFPWGALRWLFRAAGASTLEAEE